MRALKNIKTVLDRLLLVSSLTMLLAMVIIIIVQVFSRQVFSYTPSWSEEVSKILFVWVSFLGIAYGFKARLHIALGLLVNTLPEGVQHVFDYLAKALIVAFGLIMIYYGWQFTTLMGNSNMPGTGWPSSVLYAAIPVSGVFVTFYGIELFFQKGLHLDFDDVSEVQ